MGGGGDNNNDRARGGKKEKNAISPLLTPAEKKYLCYYLHQSRDSLSPVCGIFNELIDFFCKKFLIERLRGIGSFLQAVGVGWPENQLKFTPKKYIVLNFFHFFQF